MSKRGAPAGLAPMPEVPLRLSDVLGIALRHAGSALLDEPARRRLLAAAATVPPLLHDCGLELRLDGEARVDLAFAVRQEVPIQRALFLEYAEQQARAGCSPEAECLARFARSWADSASVCARSFPMLYAELDLEGDGDARPPHRPAVFLRPAADLSGRALQRALEEAARLLAGARPAAETRVGRVLDALPGGTLGFLGVFPARAGAPLRLNLRLPTLDDLAGLLQRVDWPGDMAAAAELVGMARQLRLEGVLALTIGDEVERRLGLECFPRPGSPTEGWAQVLSGLVARGLCLQSKASELLAWPGLSTEGNTPGWPTPLAAATHFFGGRLLSVITRELRHVKLGLEADSRLSAKAYAALGHRWAPPFRFPAPDAGAGDDVERRLGIECLPRPGSPTEGCEQLE